MMSCAFFPMEAARKCVASVMEVFDISCFDVAFPVDPSDGGRGSVPILNRTMSSTLCSLLRI